MPSVCSSTTQTPLYSLRRAGRTSSSFSLLTAASAAGAALAFASSLGVGVLFSTLTIGVFQGALTLLAAQAQTVLTPPVIAEMTATGGVLIMGIGFSSLLELKPIRVGNFLPALLAAPAIVLLLQAFGR